MTKHLAIIPARAGSQAIKNKNIQLLKGKSLLEWSVDRAQESGVFEQIILSTDIPEIPYRDKTFLPVDSWAEKKRITYHPRRADLATAVASMADVVTDVLQHFPHPTQDYVWLLQPTSPFRTKEDFLKIQETLERLRPASLISATDVGGAHPNRMFTIVNGEAHHLRYFNFDHRQALPKIYLRNGAFYAAQVGLFQKYRSFYIDPCRAYEMPKERSINIDEDWDLKLARAMV